MKETLLARRQQSESAFSALQSSLQGIEAELKKYGLESIQQGYDELNRLQGEYRALGDVIDNLPVEKPKKVSSKANVIDATEVEGA